MNRACVTCCSTNLIYISRYLPILGRKIVYLLGYRKKCSLALTMSDENAFDMKKFLCLMKCPCTMCCGLAYMNSAMENPPDAEKLSEDEAKDYVDQLQGTLIILFNKFLCIPNLELFTCLQCPCLKILLRTVGCHCYGTTGYGSMEWPKYNGIFPSFCIWRKNDLFWRTSRKNTTSNYKRSQNTRRHLVP